MKAMVAYDSSGIFKKQKARYNRFGQFTRICEWHIPKVTHDGHNLVCSGEDPYPFPVNDPVRTVRWLTHFTLVDPKRDMFRGLYKTTNLRLVLSHEILCGVKDKCTNRIIPAVPMGYDDYVEINFDSNEQKATKATKTDGKSTCDGGTQSSLTGPSEKQFSDISDSEDVIIKATKIRKKTKPVLDSDEEDEQPQAKKRNTEEVEQPQNTEDEVKRQKAKEKRNRARKKAREYFITQAEVSEYSTESSENEKELSDGFLNDESSD